MSCVNVQMCSSQFLGMFQKKQKQREKTICLESSVIGANVRNIKVISYFLSSNTTQEKCNV